MKEAFRQIAFTPASRARIAQMQDIVAEYEAIGITLTARQLYYQFVARDMLENTERSYQNLCALAAKARYAGLIDWEAIEDRGRQPNTPSEWSTLGGLVDSAARAFRLPRWDGQRYYVEVWVEKDALASVLEPIAAEYHVTLMANRGYSSASAMYAAAQRFVEGCGAGKFFQRRWPVLFYIGDHDPSGEDMVRDIRDRLGEFGCRPELLKLALTMEQVREHNPPPNPAKRTDSRYRRYAAKHGTQSWEVDALPPDVLQGLVRSALDGKVDMRLMKRIAAREKKIVKKLHAATAPLRKEGL